MVTYNLELGGIDREAVAEEVVGSAARVLLHVGFSEAQVGELFRQASAQLLSVETVSAEQFERIERYGEDDGDDLDIWTIADRFVQLPQVKALNRLGKRANAINDLDDPEALLKAVTLLTEAAGFRIEALAWLRGEAERAGIEIAADHHEWTASATDEQLDEEENVLFLDDYRWSGDFSWYLAGQVARALAQSGNRELLRSFSELFLEYGLGLESSVRQEIERAVGTAGQYEEFLAYVQDHVGAGELAQAEFLDKFIRSSGFPNGTYPLECWLEGMARRGELERYKRSNRWRVVVG